MNYTQIGVSYFLGIIFIFAGIDKLFHYKMFLNALASYVLMPNVLIPYFSLSLVLAEIWIGLGLIIKKYRRTASLSSFVILMIFTLALIINYIYKPGSICGCWFTITLGTVNILHIFQNFIMLILALTIWFFESNKKIE
jgi:uncharacterized membrane protein